MKVLKRPTVLLAVCLMSVCYAKDFHPGKQHFQQEVARSFAAGPGRPNGTIQLIEAMPGNVIHVFASGRWSELRNGVWKQLVAVAPSPRGHFAFPSVHGTRIETDLPDGSVIQLVRAGRTNWLLTATSCTRIEEGGKATLLPLPAGSIARQMTLDRDGAVVVACNNGLYRKRGALWSKLEIVDDAGCVWASREVLGVGCDSTGQLWFATKAGVGRQTDRGWQFFDGRHGLPWNDFTSVVAGRDGEMWFTTHLGVIRFAQNEWHYRQGLRWLPSDDVKQAAVDSAGSVWFATSGGIGCIERNPMSLAEKAEFYETEIDRYIRRTPFGYVSQAPLQARGDKSTAHPLDLDNDGLWTAMYGAGECFAHAATGSPQSKARAKQAFEALRFLQKVTQGGPHAPPKGFVARSIRPTDWPDPNVGLSQRDHEQRKAEPLWKTIKPRWPKSADGKWFWKSDTSSDELDGHYFFYPLYFDFCADSAEERQQVVEVVRDLTDHLLTHDYQLIDHDGLTTRWGVFDPQHLNTDPRWWPERGLNSLSMLTYLHVANHITGDVKYVAAAKALVEKHGYAQNLMLAKAQRGAGSGNQSDDEMAFMNYYGLLRCSADQQLKEIVRTSFFMYWQHENREMNPFFNFAYAAHCRGQSSHIQHGIFSIAPAADWLQDSMDTLHGFPLDRLNWSHRNSHRLDVTPLPVEQSKDLTETDSPRSRGSRVNGKVLPVENRHFNHWNTDPWQLDYGGDGNELAAGTVFLLPYYMGLYHGFIEK